MTLYRNTIAKVLREELGTVKLTSLTAGAVPPQTGFYLRKFAWTKIVRHRMVARRASPDVPALTRGYRTSDAAPGSRSMRPPDTLMRRQRGRCPLCRDCSCTPTTNRKTHGRMAVVAHRHTYGDPQACDHHRDRPRHAGRTRRTLSHTRLLPAPHRRRRCSAGADCGARRPRRWSAVAIVQIHQQAADHLAAALPGLPPAKAPRPPVPSGPPAARTGPHRLPWQQRLPRLGCVSCNPS